MASSSYDSTIKVWNTTKGELIITLTGHYGLNIFLIWLFAFKLNYKEIGLLYAKLGLEIYSLCAYVLVIHFQDWQKVIEETRERQKKDKE